MAVDGEILRQALAETAAGRGPGVFGLVTEHGEVVFEGTVGVADIEDPRPIVRRDRFRIGSVTKVYTATVVMQLIAEGAISLGDTVERWLPGLVPDAEAITVELLLRLRSGLPDYVGPIFGDPPDLRALDRYWSPEALVRAGLSGLDRLAPDTEFRYSNTDFVLLGLIVEKATGERIDAHMWQRIFQPLCLADTTFPTVDMYVRGQHATGYIRESASAPYVDFTLLSPSEAWTSGAIVSSALDVAAFLDGLLGGVLLDRDTLARMIDCTGVVDEHRSRGLGIIRYDFGVGEPAYGHVGGVPGYSSVAMGTLAGRSIVLWQNCIDAHDPLSSDAPFIRAALSA